MAIDSTVNLRLVSGSGLIPTYSANVRIATVTMNSGIYLQEFNGTVSNTSMQATASMPSFGYGLLTVVPKITSTGSTQVRGIIDGSVTIRKVQMLGSATRSVGISANINVNRFISSTGTIATDNFSLNGSATIKVLPNRFSFYGEGSIQNNNTPNNYTIVLNLRTKAHYVYDESTMDAHAITGELRFGSYKNKNVSDAYIFGRSSDALVLTATNDEVTSRNYDVTYAESEQQNLRNKKLKMSKGLNGKTWQFKIANTNQAFTEVRGIEFFVNELKRHV